MKKLLLTLYFFSTSVLFTAFIYNLDIIADLIADYFKINIYNPITPENVLLYLALAIFYFFNFKLAHKLFRQSIPLTFVLNFIFPILIDSTVLLGDKSLIPLRFPFASLFPIFGSGLGAISFTQKKIVFYYCLTGVTLFVVFTQLIAIPRMIWYMQSRNTINAAISQPSKAFVFKNINGDNIKLDSLRKGRIMLLDFYFVGCSPCELKLSALKKLNEKISDKRFTILLICNGAINNFTEFKKHAQSHKIEGITYLYDYTGAKNSISEVESYPFEVIIDSQLHVISQRVGYNPAVSSEYIKYNYNLVNSKLWPNK